MQVLQKTFNNFERSRPLSCVLTRSVDLDIKHQLRAKRRPDFWSEEVVVQPKNRYLMRCRQQRHRMKLKVLLTMKNLRLRLLYLQGLLATNLLQLRSAQVLMSSGTTHVTNRRYILKFQLLCLLRLLRCARTLRRLRKKY